MKFLFFIFMMANLTLVAQNEQEPFSKIYLKDGSVINGNIVDASDGFNSVKVRIVNGEELTFTKDLILKIIEPKSSLNYIGEGRSVKSKGRYFAVHFNLLSNYRISTSDNDRNPRLNLGTQLVLGHKFSEKTALGIGLGLDRYPTNVIMPVFFDFRGVWDHRRAKTAFAYNIMLGYGFHTGLEYPNTENSKYSGGLMVYPNIGTRLARKKHSNIFLDLGYKFQFTKHEYILGGWWGQERFVVEKRWFNSLTLRLGWEF